MRVRATLLICVLSAAFVRAVRAGEPAPAGDPTPALPATGDAESGAATASSVAEARNLFERGAAHHEAGEYDLAIADFEAAFALAHAPLLLFNIAQSLRLKGDCSAAMAAYRRYLAAAPDAPNRAKVEHWIMELSSCSPPPVAAALPPVAAALPRVGHAAEGPAAPVSPPPEGHRAQRILGLSFIGAGVLAAAGAGYSLLVVRRTEDEVSGRHQQGPEFLDQEAYDRGDRAATLARVLGLVSAAALAGGTVFLVSSRQTPEATQRTGGAGIVLGGLGDAYVGCWGQF